MKNSEIRRLLGRGHPEEDAYRPPGLSQAGVWAHKVTGGPILRVVHALRGVLDQPATRRVAIIASAALVVVAAAQWLVVSSPRAPRPTGLQLTIQDRSAAALAGGVPIAAIQAWGGGAVAARQVGADIQLILLLPEPDTTWRTQTVQAAPRLAPNRGAEVRAQAVTCIDTNPLASFVYGMAVSETTLKLDGPQASGGAVVNGTFVFVLERPAASGTNWSVSRISDGYIIANGTFPGGVDCLGG